MTRIFTKLIGKRGYLLALGLIAAALNAKGAGYFHTNGFHDGP